MAAGYWIKLYQDILRDPKMGRLSDSAWRRCIELFLMAGEQNSRDGFLPAVEDTAWELRVPVEQINKDLAELETAGILKQVDGRWLVVNFKKRQAAVDGRERVQRHREKKAVTGQPLKGNEVETNGKMAGNESVTKGYTDIDVDKETEAETETPQPPVGPFKKSPVKSAIKSPAEARSQVLLEICGLDPDIPDHVRTADNAAAQLAKYTPEYLRGRYAHQDSPNGSWYWYRDDWRGKTGQMPKPKDVVETVAIEIKPAQPPNATKGQTAPAPKGLAAVEQFKAKHGIN